MDNVAWTRWHDISNMAEYYEITVGSASMTLYCKRAKQQLAVLQLPTKIIPTTNTYAKHNLIPITSIYLFSTYQYLPTRTSTYLLLSTMYLPTRTSTYIVPTTVPTLSLPVPTSTCIVPTSTYQYLHCPYQYLPVPALSLPVPTSTCIVPTSTYQYLLCHYQYLPPSCPRS